MRYLFIVLIMLVSSCKQGGTLLVEPVNDGYCEVSQDANGTSIRCPSQSVYISQSLDVVDIFDPCGDLDSHPDEIILILSSGLALAVYADNGEIFLTYLDWDATYRTTDKQACVFKLSEDYIGGQDG